jgi:hypothetical protein
MATNITIEDISVGHKALVDNQYAWTLDAGQTPGILDKLIQVINDATSIQYDNGRIDDNKYADVYLGSLQTVITQSIQYALQEKLVEAQIDGIRVDNEIKLLQKIATQIDVLSKKLQLESNFPVDVTVDYINGTATSTPNVNRLGIVERQMLVEEAKVKLSKLPSMLSK